MEMQIDHVSLGISQHVEIGTCPSCKPWSRSKISVASAVLCSAHCVLLSVRRCKNHKSQPREWWVAYILHVRGYTGMNQSVCIRRVILMKSRSNCCVQYCSMSATRNRCWLLLLYVCWKELQRSHRVSLFEMCLFSMVWKIKHSIPQSSDPSSLSTSLWIQELIVERETFLLFLDRTDYCGKDPVFSQLFLQDFRTIILADRMDWVSQTSRAVIIKIEVKVL